MHHSSSAARPNPERHFGSSPTQRRVNAATTHSDIYSLWQQEKQRAGLLEKQLQKQSQDLHVLQSQLVGTEELSQIRKTIEDEITQWKRKFEQQLQLPVHPSDCVCATEAQQFVISVRDSFGKGVTAIGSLLKVHREEATQAVRSRLDALEQLKVRCPCVSCAVHSEGGAEEDSESGDACGSA